MSNLDRPARSGRAGPAGLQVAATTSTTGGTTIDATPMRAPQHRIGIERAFSTSAETGPWITPSGPHSSCWHGGSLL